MHVTPEIVPRWHGDRESAAFAALGAQEDEGLERLLFDTIAPALERRDLAEFGQALTEYNARAGEYYRSVQGGRYCDPVVEKLVDWLLSRGVATAGQSSWGPTVFAILGDQEHAQSVVQPFEFSSGRQAKVWLTHARSM